MKLRNAFNGPFALLLALGMVACGGGGQGGHDAPPTDTLAVPAAADGLVKVGNKIFSIPSPVQTVLLIHGMKAPYAAELLLPTDDVARFATKEKQALALGVYGADLAYVSAHKDGQRALKTLKATETLGTQLNLGSAFDKELMESFKKNINRQDSLLRLTGLAFRTVDKYLKNDQREDVSTRVLAGGWIEGLYLTLGPGGGAVDPKVAARLAEQRHTLDNLIELLGRDEGSAELVSRLKDLATSYAGITARYQFVEPRQDTAGKTTYINSTSQVEVSPEALQSIINKVRDIRSFIIA